MASASNHATNGVINSLQRKEEASLAAPERHTALRSAAENLSLRNVDAAVCELLNEALARLVMLVYETDAGGLCNVDSSTGRVLIPLPWGKSGHAKWGVRTLESNCLREILYVWEKETPPFFFYDRLRRTWYVNLKSFPSLGVAKGWLRAHQVSIAQYRAARAVVVAKS